MLNGINQDYVGSKINDFITWNDEGNKHKFELYVKENLPKMEIEYEKIVVENQIHEKEREEIELKKKQLMLKLFSDCRLWHPDRREILKSVLIKFNISESEFYAERHKHFYTILKNRVAENNKKKETFANKIYNDIKDSV